MISLVVDNRVTVPVGNQHTPLARLIQARFTHPNPDYPRWKRFKMGAPPDKQICTWRSEGRGRFITVPRGGFDDVAQLLTEQQIEFEVENCTTFPRAAKFDLQRPLWPHQERLVASLVHFDSQFESCLWRSPQGSGKTQAVLACAARLGTCSLIIVPTSNLFEQWAVRVQRELGIVPGRIQGKQRDVRQITIGMQQTLARCAPDFAETFGFVALDESQLAAASTVQFTIDAFKARFRLGVSGDERRADSKEFLTYDMFGPVSQTVERAALQQTGEIVPVQVRVVPTEFRCAWWEDLAADDPSNEKQLARQIRSRVHERHRLFEEIANDRPRNLQVLWCAEQALARGEQTVVLTDRREHCHALDSAFAARGVSSGLFIGGADYRDQFTLTLAGLNRGSIRAAIGTYQAVGVGFEAHARLAYGVCASPCVSNEKSRMQWNQYEGRFARRAPEKTHGVLYYLWDRHVFGMNPLRLLSKWNPNVHVLDGDQWIGAKEFLRNAKKK